MSINNFLNIEIDEDRRLLVNAETLEGFGQGPAKLGPGTTVAVTVILASKESQRCDLEIAHPEVTPWVAQSPDDQHGFSDHDHVYIVGAVTPPAEAAFLWGKEFCIGAPAA